MQTQMHVLTQADMFKQGVSLKNMPAASLLSREKGLGAPTHRQVPSFGIHIYDCTLLVI